MFMKSRQCFSLQGKLRKHEQVEIKSIKFYISRKSGRYKFERNGEVLSPQNKERRQMYHCRWLKKPAYNDEEICIKDRLIGNIVLNMAKRPWGVSNTSFLPWMSCSSDRWDNGLRKVIYEFGKDWILHRTGPNFWNCLTLQDLIREDWWFQFIQQTAFPYLSGSTIISLYLFQDDHGKPWQTGKQLMITPNGSSKCQSLFNHE